MNKRSSLTAIDIGTTKVCTIIADIDKTEGLQIKGVGFSESLGLQKGQVISIDNTLKSIRESVQKAEQSSNLKIKSAYISVTGGNIECVNTPGVITINHKDHMIRKKDLERLHKIAKSVEIPSDRMLLHMIPRTYTIDGIQVPNSPIGMHCFKLDVETHIITASLASVRNIANSIRRTGIKINDLVLGSLASSEAVLTHDEKQTGVLLADIGGGTTDIALFKDGSIWHTSVLPVAGNQITSDIAIGLQLPFDEAERIKKRFGNVNKDIENIGVNFFSTASRTGSEINYEELYLVLKSRVEEIIRLIEAKTSQLDLEAFIPAGVVLTGGSSKLPGIDTLGREILQLPVRIGIPINSYGLTEILQDPAYATSIGLLHWGVKRGNEQYWKKQGLI